MVTVSTFHGAYEIGNNVFKFPIAQRSNACAYGEYIPLGVGGGERSLERLQIEIQHPEQQQNKTKVHPQNKAQLPILTFTHLDFTSLNLQTLQ